MEILDPNANMNDDAWRETFIEYYTANATATQYSSLTLTSFGPKTSRGHHFPCLKGKGAEAKDLLPAVYEVWREVAQGHQDYDLVYGAMGSLLEVQDTLSDHRKDLILPLPATERIQVCVDDFLARY